MQKLSYVIPCYRSMQTIASVVEEIQQTMDGRREFTYEIILVNDGSPDDLWSVLCGIAKKKPNVICVDLAKNFGQYAALMAGYHYTTGDIVISLDDDGQNPADEAMKLVAKVNEGYDVVYARYKQNMESAFRRFGSWVNHKMEEYLIGKPKGIATQSFFAAKRFVIEEMLKYSHAYPYIDGLVFRSTRNVADVEVIHRSRTIGSTGYTFSKLIGMWLNGFTAFSVKPLRIATVVGALCAFSGFIFGLRTVIAKIQNADSPAGYTTIVALLLLIGGIVMLMLGLIGEYIGRIYICINQSPQYVIRETVNLEAGRQSGSEHMDIQ